MVNGNCYCMFACHFYNDDNNWAHRLLGFIVSGNDNNKTHNQYDDGHDDDDDDDDADDYFKRVIITVRYLGLTFTRR